MLSLNVRHLLPLPHSWLDKCSETQFRSDGNEFQSSQTKILSALMPTPGFQAFQCMVAFFTWYSMHSFPALSHSWTPWTELVFLSCTALSLISKITQNGIVVNCARSRPTRRHVQPFQYTLQLSVGSSRMSQRSRALKDLHCIRLIMKRGVVKDKNLRLAFNARERICVSTDQKREPKGNDSGLLHHKNWKNCKWNNVVKGYSDLTTSRFQDIQSTRCCERRNRVTSNVKGTRYPVFVT